MIGRCGCESGREHCPNGNAFRWNALWILLIRHRHYDRMSGWRGTKTRCGWKRSCCLDRSHPNCYGWNNLRNCGWNNWVSYCCCGLKNWSCYGCPSSSSHCCGCSKNHRHHRGCCSRCSRYYGHHRHRGCRHHLFVHIPE